MSEFTIIIKQILKIVYKKKRKFDKKRKKKENSTKHYDSFQNSFPFIKKGKKSLTEKRQTVQRRKF